MRFESTVDKLESLLAVNLTASKNAKRDTNVEFKLPSQISSLVEFVLPSFNTSSHAAAGRQAKNPGRPSFKPFRGFVDPGMTFT